MNCYSPSIWHAVYRLFYWLPWILFGLPSINLFHRIFQQCYQRWDHIVGTVYPWQSVFYFLDHKDFVKPNWRVALRKNIFVLLYSHMAINFEFRIFFAMLNTIFTICPYLNLSRFHFWFQMFRFVVFSYYQLFHLVIEIHTFWYCSSYDCEFNSPRFW